jgi:opacity protein-like surface antigen
MGVLAFFASMFIAAGVAVTALPARADEETTDQDFTRDGWYVQAKGLYARQYFDDDVVSGSDLGKLLPSEGDVSVVGVDIDKGGAGFNVLGGYRMGRNFAGELEFEFIEGFGVEVDTLVDDSPAKLTPYIRTYNIALSFRVYPLARLFEPDSIFNRFQPFVTAGPAWQWGTLRYKGGRVSSDGGFAGRFGAGLDFYITQNFVLATGANYMLPTCDISDLDYLSVGMGLQYRFGSAESSY